MKKLGFTLAEVLITLGIIGVVATMTMPSLIQNHEKRTFETRGAKFYSVINQAVRRSEIDNDTADNWLSEVNITNTYADYDSSLNFYNKFFRNYLATSKIEPYSNTYQVAGDENETTQTGLLIYLTDGSAITMYIQSSVGVLITYFPKAKDAKANWSDEELGRYAFQFSFLSKNQQKNKFTSVEPYTLGWDGTSENLISHNRYGCRKGSTKMFCTKLIQQNGWKLPKDYPW